MYATPAFRPAPGDIRPVPAVGYPLNLPTAAGLPLSVVIDATGEAAFGWLWGMSLLERNCRLVERLGAEKIHVLVRSHRRESAARRRFSSRLQAVVHVVEGEVQAAAVVLVRPAPGAVLLLEGEGLYDRRFIGALWQCAPPACGSEGGGGLEAAALLVDLSSVGVLLGASGWKAAQEGFSRAAGVRRLELSEIDARVGSLRKSVAPRVMRVVDGKGVRRADRYLRDLAAKGVNDLLAEFVHPPIEFLLTRLAAATPVTPNQISCFNALLSLATLPLIAAGRLWEGVALNLLRGVMDGVDGKLARLSLRESKGGDRLDHVVDRLYLPAFFLALGWHLSAGKWTAPAALVAGGLQIMYALNRIFATWFRNFTGVSSGELRPVDRLVRRIWPKRNICVSILLAAMLAGRPQAGLYGMAGLTGFMVLYRMVRLDQEGRRRHEKGG